MYCRILILLIYHGLWISVAGVVSRLCWTTGACCRHVGMWPQWSGWHLGCRWYDPWLPLGRQGTRNMLPSASVVLCYCRASHTNGAVGGYAKHCLFLFTISTLRPLQTIVNTIQVVLLLSDTLGKQQCNRYLHVFMMRFATDTTLLQ